MRAWRHIKENENASLYNTKFISIAPITVHASISNFVLVSPRIHVLTFGVFERNPSNTNLIMSLVSHRTL